jgi:hypothetical protein
VEIYFFDEEEEDTYLTYSLPTQRPTGNRIYKRAGVERIITTPSVFTSFLVISRGWCD